MPIVNPLLRKWIVVHKPMACAWCAGIVCAVGLEVGKLLACRTCARVRYGDEVPDSILAAFDAQVDHRLDQLPTGDR